MGQANIARGEKWLKVMKDLEFQDESEDVEWMKTQKSIMDDIKEYEDSISKPSEDVKKTSKKA